MGNPFPLSHPSGLAFPSPPATFSPLAPFSCYGPHCPLASPELRQWEEQGELFLPLTFLLLVLSSLLLYLAVSLMDPGYVTTQPQPQVTRDREVQTSPWASREVRPQKHIDVKP